MFLEEDVWAFMNSTLEEYGADVCWKKDCFPGEAGATRTNPNRLKRVNKLTERTQRVLTPKPQGRQPGQQIGRIGV